MRKWTLLCGVVIVAGFMAAPAPAQEPIKLPATVIQSSQPVVVQQQRYGLFGRRTREVMMPVNQQIVQAQALQMPATVLPAQATQTVPLAVQPQLVPERRQGLLVRLRGRRGY